MEPVTILSIFAAMYFAAGAVKATVIVQQIPALMNWYVFYQTNDSDQADKWYEDKGLVVAACFVAAFAAVIFAVLGGILVKNEGRRLFHPYGDPYIASVAAKYMKIDSGVLPYEFETWDDYQIRIGDKPANVAAALVRVQPEVPQEIKDVIEVAEELQAAQDRDYEPVAEEDEFK